jgi:hypothetical protein
MIGQIGHLASDIPGWPKQEILFQDRHGRHFLDLAYLDWLSPGHGVVVVVDIGLLLLSLISFEIHRRTSFL